MNKKRIFSALISVILGLFCATPSSKAVSPKNCYETPYYTLEASSNFLTFIRENPGIWDIIKKIEIAEDCIHQGIIDFKNPAKSICCFLHCKESEVGSLLKVEKRWFKKDDEKIRILNHFFKLVQYSKIQLGCDIKENETICYTAEAFDRMMRYLIENKCKDPDSRFFTIIEQIELIWSQGFSSKLLIDFSNPVPKLCEILKCSDEKELTELLKCEEGREVPDLLKNLSLENRMLKNFFELVRSAKQKFLSANP